MTDPNAKLDRAARKELAVPDNAWIRQVGRSTIEVGLGDLGPVASATDHGDYWAVQLPDEIIFAGGGEMARRLLWQAAAAAPTRPATPPRPRPRIPFDHLNSL